MAKILVADDEPMIRDLLRRVLIRHHHEIIVASDGREAVDGFRQHRPDVVLVDLHMPGLNGLEVLRQIRGIDPACAVIVLTGGGTDTLEAQARQFGATDFVRKGLSLDDLIVATNTAAARPRPVREGPSHDQDGIGVLVVDDEDLIRRLIAEYLSRRGYRVHQARDGADALALAEQVTPDIVLLDMYMPGINGVGVLRELQQRRYAGKVIVVSASQDEALLQEALALGSIDVLGKPVDLTRLELVIQVGLSLKGG